MQSDGPAFHKSVPIWNYAELHKKGVANIQILSESCKIKESRTNGVGKGVSKAV